MKKVLILIGISICSLVSAKTYYVSTNGNNNNPGSISQPWRTWEMAFMTAQAGDTVFFRGGVYPHPVAGGLGMWVYNSGTRANPICFFNYPGEEPILDASNVNPTSGLNYGIRIEGVEFIHIKGLTLRNFREIYPDVLCSGINSETGEQITLENIKAYNINGIGIGVYNYGDTIRIKNCDVWNVCDSISWWPGQNGVGIQLGNMPSTYGSKVYSAVTYVEGCRVWSFSDNGIAAANGGYVEIKDCWVFDGGYLNGEGCGFKMGPATTSVDHTTIPLQKKLTNCISAVNCYYGYSDNNRGFPPMNSQYINCVAYRNGYKDCGDITTGYGWYNLNYLDIYPAPNWITLNCISYDNESGTPGNYYPGGTEDTFLERYNSWNNPPNVTVTNADFLSLDWTEMLSPRRADNSLPDINFMKLAAGSDLIDAGLDTLGIAYKGSAPDIGYSEYESGSISPTSPVYVSSVIENATPSRLEMTYNLTLANITPAASAFTVRVNSTARTVSAVAISGTKVLLTLASPVVYGDVVTIAYTKPASNPLQTPTGGQAASISAQNVTNNVAAINPIYVSSVIENATPSRLEMTYNLTLANITPAASAFTVRVNSTARTVSAVAISGTKVLLTLASPVVYGDVVTIAYTKPASNPLQTPTGGQAASISAQNVTNNVAAINPVYVSSVIENATPSRLEMTYNLTLANITPAASAFTVRVNSTARTVSAVAISGTKVLLTLASPVVYGDVVTIAYTKPASNPLQTPTGGQAASISAQNVTNNVAAINPVYVSSVIENATPSRLEMTYNLTLANITPAASAFTVRVNSTARTVSAVAISGTKVLLTLASPVVYGDVVTIAYTKPASNPLQTPTGGQAASISAQNVTNNVAAINPIYVSSVIENATPSRLEMTYNLTLANITPAASAFTVRVNSTARTVSAVAISGTKVLLTLASPVVYGDVVTIAYTKPASNPLQTPTGGQAASISAQNVTNNVAADNQPPYVNISSPTKSTSFIAPATITIEAVASDADGYISKVEFFQGAVKLGEITAPPYSFTWKSVPEGTYSISAIAYDNQNLHTTSEAVSVVVEKSTTSVNQQPTVRIISPTNGKKHKKNDKIAIEVLASDPDGSISKVEIKNGSVTLAEVTTEPYIYNWEATDTGTFVISAIATDNLGATSAATSVELFVGLVRDINSENIRLYPNPNNGNFTVELLPGLPENSNIVTVVSLAGKTVYKGLLSKEENEQNYYLSGLSSGTYFLIVTSGQNIVATKKFIKN